MTSDVVLYGLHIRSDVPVPGRPAAPGAPVDLEVSFGPTVPVQAGAPDGEVLAYHKLEKDKWYSFARSPGGGFTLRIFNVCDFVVSADLRRADVRAVEGGWRELVPVFTAGALPAFVLLMKGEPIMHASAVDVGGRVVAFLGRSGMGKSTVAALFCSAGAGLVTDDVLRVTRESKPRCYLGAHELRLRGRAVELTADFAVAPSVAPTADGRAGVRAEPSVDELAPLAAIIVPLPDRQRSEPLAERLSAAEGLRMLLRFPRLLGWRHIESQARQFQVLAGVSDAVPVFTVRIPWGPPFPPGLAGDLLGCVGVEGPSLRS